MITTGSQNSQFTRNSKKKSLFRWFRSQDLLENISLRFLWDFNYLLLPDQYNNFCFTIASFQLHEYSLKTNFWNDTKFGKEILTTIKELLENLSLKLLCVVIFPLLLFQSDILCFLMTSFLLDDHPLHQTKKSHIKFKHKIFKCILEPFTEF